MINTVRLSRETVSVTPTEQRKTLVIFHWDAHCRALGQLAFCYELSAVASETSR